MSTDVDLKNGRRVHMHKNAFKRLIRWHLVQVGSQVSHYAGARVATVAGSNNRVANQRTSERASERKSTVRLYIGNIPAKPACLGLWTAALLRPQNEDRDIYKNEEATDWMYVDRGLKGALLQENSKTQWHSRMRGLHKFKYWIVDQQH